MTKRFLAACALLFALASALSAERRYVIKTDYFDVIHGPRSADTAALVASHADAYVREICGLLDTEMKKRMPVYVESDAALLNAWYSPYPYAHIVLLDTSPTDGDLAGNTDSILSVFYHELTHAVSLSIRTPFWQFVSSVVGDFVSINSALTMPLSFMEGVTVSLESRDGEGRLNDPAALHLLQQDKLEGRFLSWKEAAGALDLYPAGRSYYLYGGFFADWLQRTRGMQLYADFWNRGASFNPFASYTQTRFRQIYGESLDEAWTAFEDSIPLPASIQENGHRVQGTADGVQSLLDSRADRIVWLDLETDSVMLRDVDGTVRRLFDADGTLNRLSLSPDGSAVLVSGAILRGSETFDQVRVFEIDAGRFTGERYPSHREAAFLDDGTGLVAVRSVSQKISLVIVRRNADEEPEVILEAGPGTERALVLNPVDAGNGSIAFIEATGTRRSIVLLERGKNTFRRAVLPPSFGYVRSLTRSDIAGKPSLVFSWSSPGTFYRAAVYDTETQSVRSQTTDYSGGVYYPVYDGLTASLVYVSRRSGYTRLSEFPSSSLAETASFDSLGDAGRADQAPKAVPSKAFEIYPFSPLPWMLDGVFIPVAKKAPSNVSRATGNVLPGFLYITGSPTDESIYTVSPSFSADPFFVDFSLDAAWVAGGGTFSAELDDRLRPYPVSGDAYRDLALSLSFASVSRLTPLWNRIDWELSASGHWYGRASLIDESYYGEPFASSSVGLGSVLSWQAIRSAYIAQFPVFAVTRTGPFAATHVWYGLQLPDRTLTPLAQASAGWHVPHVPLTLEIDAAWSDGLLFGPVSTRADAPLARDFEFGVARYVERFPEYAGTPFDIEGAGSAFSARAEISPFTLEIQRGVPLFPLYANRFVVTGGYRAGCFFRGDGSALLLDSGYGRVSVQGAVIMGALSAVVLTLQAEYSQAIRTDGFAVDVSFVSSFSL